MLLIFSMKEKRNQYMSLFVVYVVKITVAFYVSMYGLYILVDNCMIHMQITNIIGSCYVLNSSLTKVLP